MRKLVIFIVAVLVLTAASPVHGQGLLPFDLVDDPQGYTKTAVKAANDAANSFNGQGYNWEKNAHCSTYASRYIEKLGLAVSRPEDYANADVKEFPWASTVMQVAWLEKNVPNQVIKVTVNDLLDGKLWGSINPGALIYFQTRINHNGNNEYSHVVILLGYNKKGEPIFAEFVPSMQKGPRLGRTLHQVAGMYKYLGDNKWNLSTFDPKIKGQSKPEFLYVTIFDAVGAEVKDGSPFQ